MIPLGEERRLGRAAYYVLAGRRSTTGIVLMAVALLVSIGGQGSRWLIVASLSIFVAGMLALAIGLVVARIEYARRTIAFEEFDLKLSRGIVRVTEVTIPYRQIQSIDIERGLMHQMTKTARVVIDSAGQEEADEKNETDIVLDPVDHELADEIRLTLERKIGVQVVQTEEKADMQAGKYEAPGGTA